MNPDKSVKANTSRALYKIAHITGLMSYAFTVTDPLYYTRTWTGENHFLRTHELMFEFACHEGNYSQSGILQGARASEAMEAKH